MRKNVILWSFVLFFLLFGSHGNAKSLSGVKIAEKITTSDGAELVLNGAGVRTKFFFDIYVCALYLPKKMQSREAIYDQDQRKRLLMHFVYDEVSKKKLVSSFKEGFEDNTAKVERTALQARIYKFLTFFGTVREGDRVVFDFMPGQGVEVRVNDELKGEIKGGDFAKALLAIWLGDDPVKNGLKKRLLGRS